MGHIGKHWRWYFSHLGRHWRSLALFTLIGTALAALNLPLLWALQKSLDKAMTTRDLAPLLNAALLFLACRFAIACVSIGVSRKSTPLLRRMGADMRIEIVEALHTRLWQDVAAMEDASVQAKLIHDTERVEQMTQNLFNAILPQIIPLIGYGLLAAWLSWKLTLLAAVLALVMRVATRHWHRTLSQETVRFQNQYELFHIDIVRVLFMMPVSMLLGHERASIDRFANEAHTLAGHGTRLSATMVLTKQLGALTNAVVMAALLLGGGYLALQGELSAGSLAAFLVTLRLAQMAIMPFLNAVPLAVAGDSALANLELLRHSRRPITTGGLPSPTARLNIADVRFAYGTRSILDGISLAPKPGTITALIAPNGVGKSTLLNIVSGVPKPDSGTAEWIAADGTSRDVADCRPSIGVVPQHPRFFHASFRENILCYRSGISDAALNQAAADAMLGPIMARHAEGLDAIMVDGGQLLSGGERQRLALARALVNNPALLVLDEPTNHLDTASVSELFNRIVTAPEPPAILVATHDERVLQLADAVLHLQDGKLVPRSAQATPEHA